MAAAAAAFEALLEMEGQLEQPGGEVGILAHLLTHSIFIKDARGRGLC